MRKIADWLRVHVKGSLFADNGFNDKKPIIIKEIIAKVKAAKLAWNFYF